MTKPEPDYQQLLHQIRQQALSLGFQQLGISDLKLDTHEAHLQNWLEKGFQGEMQYMSKHGLKRSRPQLLVENTIRVISVSMDYLPPTKADSWEVLANSDKAFVSRYATGRDYHKLMRKRLQKLADFISSQITEHEYRVFVDSAPVLEKAIAEKAGLGWIGKHTNLINRKAGSWFFLGEIYTNLPLPPDEAEKNHCGSCSACLDICPTQAIVADYVVDARRCISYLTIELDGVIPVEFRHLIGNRIYGCDDCQLICPWNRFAKISLEKDFQVRHHLDNSSLLELFDWNETQFESNMAGSAIRRIGYQRWQRNIAIALGNSVYSPEKIKRLEEKRVSANDVLAEHLHWAIETLQQSKT